MAGSRRSKSGSKRGSKRGSKKTGAERSKSGSKRKSKKSESSIPGYDTCKEALRTVAWKLSGKDPEDWETKDYVIAGGVVLAVIFVIKLIR